jgi:hypothetical protein
MQQAKVFPLLSAAVVLFSGLVLGQDAQTLGDAARQVRQQKQAKPAAPAGKEAPAAKTPKVITNDEIPAHFQPVSKVSTDQNRAAAATPAHTDESRMPAEHWRSQIEAQKNLIGSLQSQIDQLSESIRFAPANCVANCVQWNERQREKQQQVETMKAQLADQQKRLEDMQEQARKQGYGSSVYDP